ncbi:MAG: response regulator [Sulfuricella sp.]|nr:response regulator [Sulfuricella sp.]
MESKRILIVEDEPVNRELLVENLSLAGYETEIAATGEEAWRMLSENPGTYDMILLDRLMPDMDGIEILRRSKENPTLIHTPLIMHTAMSSDADIAEGLRAGAYYYLTKPYATETLLAIVATAAEDHRQQLELQSKVHQAARTLTCLKNAQFQFSTPDQARDIATLVATATPNPERVVLGLTELMLNAVEHGNLGIGYAEKSRLIEEGRLFEEIAKRLDTPDHAGKQAMLEFSREGDEFRFLIRDLGSGFDWRDYLEISPERAFDTHGRGIAMSRMISFDCLEYQGCGNQVLARVTMS